jgi:hypothetical protein
MAVRSLKNSTLENFSNYSSSMNAGYDFNDFELIESVFVASNTATVTFSNLNQYATEYKHLQIRYTAKSTRPSYLDGLAVRFNSDTGTNYGYHWLRGDGSSVTSGAEINVSIPQIGIIPASTSTANTFGAGVADLLDPFSLTKYKTFRSVFGTFNGNYLAINSGLWRNTNAVNSITLLQTEGANNLLAGSRFSLYGIR